MMAFKKHVWLFSFVLIINCFLAQNRSFNFQRIGIEDGLNSLNIFNIEQDSNRIVHITTENGVYLYNGYQFKQIKTDTLSQPLIINSFVNNNNNILLSTRDQGLISFNHKTNAHSYINIKNYKNSADNIILSNDYIYMLSTPIKLDIFDRKNNKIIEDKIREKNKNNQANCIFKSKNGKIYIGRSDGIYLVENSTQTKMDVLNNISVHAITENKEGKLIVGASSKIYFISNNKIEKEISPKYINKSSTFSIGGERNINKIICDDQNKIWFTSYPNENVYLFDNGQTYDVFSDLNISATLINCLYKDSDNNIWIGTYDDGIYLIQNSFFTNINVKVDDKTLNVNKIFIKKDYIFTATNNGFYGINLNNNELKVISKPDNIIIEPIYDICESDNKILYSKRSQFDLSPSKFSYNDFTYDLKPVLGKVVFPLKDKLIICDWMANVLLTNKEGNKVIDTLISFPDYRISINCIYIYNENVLIASNKGLYYYDVKTKKNGLYSEKYKTKINDIALINGELFLAHEEGITSLKSGKIIKQVGLKTLSGVKKIKTNQELIWLVTLDGLIICDKNLIPLKIFNKTNGLLSSAVNDISFNDKMICISTSKGISIAGINDLLNYNSTLSKVNIDRIKINDKTVAFGNSTIELSTEQNDVTIYFNSSYFSKPNKQFIKYKIDNSEWISIDNTIINLPILEGGRHSVEIIVSIDNISWSQSAVIEFNKAVKFSETQYIYWIIVIGSIIIITLISYVLIKRTKTKALKRIQEEQQVNLLKHQAMNALLSPHFIFNSLTSIQNYINSNNSLKASEYLAKFSRLIRMIIEKAAQSDILLKDEITRLSYYLELEKERFKNKFDYTINVDEGLDVNTIKIPNMIIQPHAENCIIHGILPKMEHGTLTINFKKSGTNKMIITLEDDGIGLIKAKEHSKTGHKSLGTSTIKSILDLNSKLFNKTQSVNMIDKSTLNNDQHGTLITIELEL